MNRLIDSLWERRVFEGISNFANLGSILKQAQQMKNRLQGLSDDLKTRKAMGSAGGGMVTVEVNGIGEVLSCRIDPSLVSQGDREMIEDLLPGAINQALGKAKQLHAEAVKSMAQGLEMPGLNEMLSQLGGGEPSKET
jgi:DNA-binding YbaB/EbfC family protein